MGRGRASNEVPLGTTIIASAPPGSAGRLSVRAMRLRRAIGYRRLICDRATAGGERFSIVPGALASSPVREVWRSRLWESRARRSSPREPPSIAQFRQHASREALSIAGKPSIRDGLGPGKSDPELPRALALFVICPFATVAFPHAQFRCGDARLVPRTTARLVTLCSTNDRPGTPTKIYASTTGDQCSRKIVCSRPCTVLKGACGIAWTFQRYPRPTRILTVRHSLPARWLLFDLEADG
jgi:hypothetical protein